MFDPAKEDRKLNQYWFSTPTIEAYLQEITMHATRCAFLSTPSLYFAIPPSHPLRAKSCIFEFDPQWEQDEGFVFFDFNKVEETIPKALRGKFDYIVVDPPFISEEVWTKYAHAVSLLAAPTGAKYLLTSTRENFEMLQRVLKKKSSGGGDDMSEGTVLYMSPFQPSIKNLTYQYDTFFNYNPTTAAMGSINPEIGGGAGEVAAIRMLNDLKESQEAFAQQMRTRDRTGEQKLPEDGANRMLWNRVPEGLTEYPEGYDPAASEAGPQDFGPAYAAIQTRRALCETFKKNAEASTRALKDELASKKKSTALDGHLDAMRGAMGELTTIGSPQDADVIGIMTLCLGEVTGCRATATGDDDPTLKTLIGEMTRKYKSRIFNHQKVLLQGMKEAKEAFLKKN
eukprot:PhF_6_TR23813/c0_g1_i1/m.33344